MENLRDVIADVRKLVLQVGDQQNEIALLKDQTVQTTGAIVPAKPPTVQSSNQLRNGDLSHSVRTWFETTFADDDANKECALYYSHEAPGPGQVLYEGDSLTGGTSRTLKTPAHPAYNQSFSDWDREHGWGRLNGTATIDAPLPQNFAGAGKTEHFVVLAARRHRYITFSPTCRMFAGIWDDTPTKRDYIRSATPFTLRGGIVGSGATTPRTYRVFARTDRGYSFLSTELTLNAPVVFVPNSFYAALNWDSIAGVLAYEVYRLTGSTYELLFEVTNGATSYNDQNSVKRAVSGYPPPTDSYNLALYATRQGELQTLAIDGVSAAWNTIEFPIAIPADYDQSATTGRQWVRCGLTEPANLQIPAGSGGGVDVYSTTALFEPGHVGKLATLLNKTDGVSSTSNIASYISPTHITLNEATVFGGDETTLVLTIFGGGSYGVLVDLLHTSYASGSVYSPNAEDYAHTLQPAAAPNGSSQGGVGVGGDAGDTGTGTGGGIRCLWENETVVANRGVRFEMPAKDVVVGEALESGNLQPNYVQHVGVGRAEIVEVRTANGWLKRCTATHRLMTSAFDTGGTMVKRLKAGDYVLTDTGGVVQRVPIASIVFTGRTERVVYYTLTPGRVFMSGVRELSFWGKIRNLFRRRITGGILDHNLKRDDEALQPDYPM